MLQKLLNLSHLPNLHPAVLHFPIVLFCLALAAVVTFFSGRSAANSLGKVPPPDIQEAITAHSDMALRTVWAFGILAVLRGLLLVVAVFSFWLLLETADRGGAPVYTYGVAVKAVAAPASSSPASDPTLLPAALQIETASPDASVHAERIEGHTEGLKLSLEGRVYLLFPEDMGDVVVSLDSDPSNFDGILGLVHHYRGPTTYESVTLATTGSALLQSVADGLTILHGHRDPTNTVGKTGLVCEGTGTLALDELSATPASGEANG